MPPAAFLLSGTRIVRLRIGFIAPHFFETNQRRKENLFRSLQLAPDPLDGPADLKEVRHLIVVPSLGETGQFAGQVVRGGIQEGDENRLIFIDHGDLDHRDTAAAGFRAGR